MNLKKSIIIYILAVAGIFIVLNILASRFFFRLDFTEDSRYTLSKATKNLLKGLDGPVTVTAYFSEGLPPDIDRTRREFKELLSEYSSRSKGKVQFEFVNPNKNDQTAQSAQQNGISPVMINVREKDQSVQKKAFLGAILKYEGKSEVVPFIQPGTSMEYTLSSGIKKLVVDNKALVGFIQGHGEPSTSMFSQAMQPLSILYQVEGVNLTDSTNLSKYKTLVLMAPTDTIPPQHMKMLDDYLAGGGNMVVGINRVEGNLNQGTGIELSTGLETWLARKGIQVDNSFLVDASCGSVGVTQQQGMFSFTSQVSFPYLPVFSSFGAHPVTTGLEAVIMQFASPLTFTGDSTVKFTPLVFSSEKSGTQSVPLYFDIQKKWGKSDFPLSKLVAAAVAEGKLSGPGHSRMVIIGDGDFAVNGQGNSTHQIQPDNVNLLVNSIDWLSDDTGLIELRTRGITARLLKQIDDGEKSFLKWLNLLLPVILAIGIGILRMQRNRVVREKRRMEDYNY